MVKKKAVPDAWEDDWEAQADKVAAAEGDAAAEEQAPLSKAERLAKHEESNRKLWESAESPQEFHFLAAGSSSSGAAPVAGSGFKPAMKVLSRKPAPQMIAKKDPVTGVARMSLQDDDDEAEEAKDQETPEERRARQQRELEEKQRRYDEARAKIFGETPSSAPSRQPSSPGTGTVTPPHTGDGRQNQRGRGRGRGGGGGYRGEGHSRHDSQGKRSPAQPSNASGTRELYDPNYAPKPGFGPQKRADGGSQQPARAATPRAEDQIIRTPRGPDGSGRGGFGFARQQPAKDG